MNELTRRAPEIRDRASKCETADDVVRKPHGPMVYLKPMAVLIFIEEYLSANGGVSPSQDEIARAFGQKKRGACTYNALKFLEDAGFIRRSIVGRRTRDIEVLRPQRTRIPIFRASDNKLMGWLP